mmetsp:Transcript_38330/g.92444  ORF Transcript_38330/g.92444 Transcript_38330/m.92444 type:complete len:87 (-) Transcript_38330:329-589(-)
MAPLYATGGDLVAADVAAVCVVIAPTLFVDRIVFSIGDDEMTVGSTIRKYGCTETFAFVHGVLDPSTFAISMDDDAEEELLLLLLL